MTLDRVYAARCADEYAEKTTPARAHNAAQHLAPALAEITRLEAALAAALGDTARREVV